MDLRDFNLTSRQVDAGVAVLNYQPFIISDDLQTGVAYSWLYGEEGGRSSGTASFVLDRKTVETATWERFSEANQRLRRMYDDWTAEIAITYAGGTLLDPACNNG